MIRHQAEKAARRTIVQGRAMVRLIDATTILLANSGGWHETLLLKLARTLYQRRLRGAIVMLPSDIAAEILAASEGIGGNLPVTHDPMMN